MKKKMKHSRNGSLFLVIVAGYLFRSMMVPFQDQVGMAIDVYVYIVECFEEMEHGIAI
jgi:hypothetical protein